MHNGAVKTQKPFAGCEPGDHRDAQADVRTRWEMTDYEQKVLEDLSALKTQMHQLMGIGQPGRLQALEGRVECHERNMQRMKGFVGAFGGVLTFLHMAISYLTGKHN